MAEEKVKTTQCPFCKEEIRADAVVCRHCGSRLAAPTPEHGGVCPYCKETIHPEATRCKHCGSDLRVREASGCGCAPVERYVEEPLLRAGGQFGERFGGPFRERLGTPFRERLGGQFRNREAGQCYSRCLLACGSSSPECSLLCAWICEGAPETETVLPRMVQ